MEKAEKLKDILSLLDKDTVTVDEIEDAGQFRKWVKNRLGITKTDNILYSQEMSDSDLFDKFKERLLAERKGIKPKGINLDEISF